MNEFIITGNLTRDPELSKTPSGVSLCRFRIAVQRDYYSAGGEKKTDFFDITSWRETAENVAKYVKKGNKVLVRGSVELREYEDNNGVKRTAVDVAASKVEFLSPPPKGRDEPYQSGATQAQQAQTSPRAKTVQLQAFDDDEDVPF